MVFKPMVFMQEVRREIAKVTWPTRKETWITTAMVLVLTLLAALFFMLVDAVIGWAIRFVLGLGG